MSVDSFDQHTQIHQTGYRYEFKICIIGGGLVGLALAILLRKERFPVTILERDSALTEIGAGINLPVNCCRVLQDIGVMEEVRQQAIAPPNIVLHSYRNGHVLHCMNLDPLQKRYGFPYLVIHRADLRRILYDRALAVGVNIRMGVRIDWPHSDVRLGIITSVNGEKFHADLAVGADGEYSKTREIVLGKKNDPKPTGMLAIRVLIDIATMEAAGLSYLLKPANMHLWLGPESMAVTYQLKGVYNIALCQRSPGTSSQPFSPRGAVPVDAESVESFYSGWDSTLKLLLETGSGYSKWNLMFQDEPATDYVDTSGKAIIIGDAADKLQPYLAQGAAMGFEAASELSHLLAKASSAEDVDKLLRVFQSVRRKRADRVLEATNLQGHYWTLPDGPEQQDRDHRYEYEASPQVGYPNMLLEPSFQAELFSYNGKVEAEQAWQEVQTQIVSM